MLIEGLVIKGLVVAGKFIASHGLAAKAGLIATKAITTYGVASTIGTTLTVGAVIGGVSWGADRIKWLTEGIEYLANGDKVNAAKKFARLALSTHLEINTLADAARDCVLKAHESVETANHIRNEILSIKDEIRNQM